MCKVNDGRTKDGRRTTDDGQRVITIVHLSLRLRCTKKFFQNTLNANDWTLWVYKAIFIFFNCDLDLT